MCTLVYSLKPLIIVKFLKQSSLLHTTLLTVTRIMLLNRAISNKMDMRKAEILV